MNTYIVWRPENGQTEDDGQPFRAMDAAAAVREWAEWDDRTSADYHIVGGTPAEVMVREVGSQDAPRTYIASGEAEPVYYVLEKQG